jgi:hypothetical protein
MTDTPSTPATPGAGDRTPGFLHWLEGRSEVVVVVLLGLVSIATAYASFQSALWGGESDDLIARSQAAETAAESIYLEANQQYVQDAATVLRLAELTIDTRSSDATVAEDAQAKYDEIYFIGVSEDLDAAIQAADAANADPSVEFYTYPLDDETYQANLFGGYYDEKENADALKTEGDRRGDNGDLLGLTTAIMAITLFLLGIAAVVKNVRTRWVLIAIGMVIFTGTAVLTATVPFTWIGAE